jgi:hypothetical protein
MIDSVLGIDPGPTTGVCLLVCDGPLMASPLLYQCNHRAMESLLFHLVERHNPTYIAYETWAPGKARGGGSTVTKELIGNIASWWPSLTRGATAGMVKPWATDKRLNAVSEEFKRDATGMRHARDAGRHALFCAVNQGLMPDPLSRKARVS